MKILVSSTALESPLVSTIRVSECVLVLYLSPRRCSEQNATLCYLELTQGEFEMVQIEPLRRK